MNNLKRIEEHVSSYGETHHEVKNIHFFNVYVPIGLLILFMLAFIPFSFYMNLKPSYFLGTYIVCMVIGALIGIVACGGERFVDVKYQRKQLALIIYLKSFDVKQELIDLFKQNISNLDKGDSWYEILLHKNERYLNEFITRMEGKDKNNWDYYRCIYEYYYFCRHLKNSREYSLMNAKIFETVYYIDDEV